MRLMLDLERVSKLQATGTSREYATILTNHNRSRNGEHLPEHSNLVVTSVDQQ